MEFLLLLLVPALFMADTGSNELTEDDDAADAGSTSQTLPPPTPEPIADQGTAGDDSIYAGYQNDLIEGLGGHDTIFGGHGDDTILGGEGHDLIAGNEGNDDLRGGADRDLLYGDAGDDLVHGGSGNDILVGGDGQDTLYGGLYDDVFVGYDCSNLDEAMTEGSHENVILQSEPDQPDSSGADSFHGGYGDDLFLLGGEDTATGGEGEDIFFIPHNAEGTVTITDFVPGEDVVVLSHLASEGDDVQITSDAQGNALISLNGELVAVLSDMAGEIEMGDIGPLERSA